MKPSALRILLLAFSVAGAGFAGKTELLVDGSFPGGNILINRLETNQVYLRQDLRDTIPGVNWFYWHFRARNAQGRHVTFHFTNGTAVSSRGPAISHDSGRSWFWLGINTVRFTTNGFDFEYPFPKRVPEARFCVAPSYLQSDLNRFLRRHARDPALSVGRLCSSKKSRPVELLRAGRVEEHPPLRVLVTARHHACESIASFTLEGLLESVLAPNADGAWLRQNVELVAVPFMDKDGVEDGDQGKCRAPHDHWQDYTGVSLYPEVAALKRLVAQWPNGSLRFALDLHCPELRGAADGPGDAEVIFFAGSMVPSVAAEANVFQRILEREGRGPLRYFGRHDLPAGARWNREEEIASTCLAWESHLPGIAVATVMEIPYATAGGQEVSPASARALGGDLAHALRRYFENKTALQNRFRVSQPRGK